MVSPMKSIRDWSTIAVPERLCRAWTALTAWLMPLPWWLVGLAGILLGAVPGALFGATKETAVASIGLIGVALGGIIAAATNFITGRATRRAQVATATWPKRLEAHQIGFELWWRVVHSAFKDEKERGEVIIEAQTWWTKNCLYLSDQARREFTVMLSLANSHRELVRMYRGTGDPDGVKLIRQNWETIRGVGATLARGAGGHLSDDLLKDLTSDVGEPSSEAQ
jgi:hypothetical protein